MLVMGSIFAGGGLIMLVVGLINEGPNIEDPGGSHPHTFTIGGTVAIGVGLGAIAGGIVLLETTRTAVKFTQRARIPIGSTARFEAGALRF